MTLRDKMLAVMQDVNSQVAEREELVELIAIALLTRNNLFILGKPGQAKSLSINLFRQRITGARQFERLLSKQTDEDQLFGRIDLSSLIPGSVPDAVLQDNDVHKNLRFDLQCMVDGLGARKDTPDTFAMLEKATDKLLGYRKAVAALHQNEPVVQTAGKIPEADIVFLDEIFKANDGVLNSLLTALNERKYTNEGRTYPIPAISFFAASNEIPNFADPQEQILAPLYDRLQIKVVTEDIADRDKRLTVLKSKQNGGDGSVNATISLSELYAMQQEVAAIPVPDAINELADDVLCELWNSGIEVSDRKYLNYYPLVQAKAWLEGHDKVEPQDLLILKCYLWQAPSDRPTVENTLTRLCVNPLQDKGALNTLEKLETARDAAAEELAKLLSAQATGETTETDKQELINAANRLDSKQRQMEAVSQMLDTTMLRQTDTVDLAVSAAVQAATVRAQEVQSIIGAWSDEPLNMRRTPENLALLKKVRQSTTLKDISKYLGRFREIFAQAKKNSYAYGRGETYSLELGNNLSRALTSELAMLATPETIPLFLRKYQQKQIKQYRRREPIYKGVGDIICCLDESSSTEGEAAAWGKAVAMTLLEIAAESHRSFALIHFAGGSSCQVDIFRPGEYTLEDKLSAAETFLGGGTNFERPVREAIRLMDTEGFEKADVVFITDGECELSVACQQELQTAQVAYHFTVTGILLDEGQADMDFSLKPFCQKIYRTSELTGDAVVQSVISLRV